MPSSSSLSSSLASDAGSLDTSAAHTLSLPRSRLRAEVEATTSDERRGLLLHELGLLEDEAHNDGQAVRDLLSAVNALPGFHEPIERLIVLIERRKSYKNLGKLLDRLVKVAETPEEMSRALIALAAYREDHEDDRAGAREALERATQAKGDDGDAWLALERSAAKSHDNALRRRALGARAELAVDQEWRALLSLDVARLHEAEGDLDAAVSSLERALSTRSSASFVALTELESLARTMGRADLVMGALEQRAALLERAIGGDDSEEARGVPEDVRTNAHLAETWLRVAHALREQGKADRALAALDRVVAATPTDSVAIAARLRAAEAAGDTVTAAALAKAELAEGVRGPVAAALWMRVTEAAASNGDVEGALQALSSALAEDPGCIPARALELDLLGGAGNPAALAEALDAAASELGDSPLASELYLLAADTATRGAGDTNTAKAALSQAAAAGASLEAAARTGRLLAALSNDGAWFDESTRRVLATNPDEGERVGLRFELLRSRLLRGDTAASLDAVQSLSGSSKGAWLGSVLGAYAVKGRDADAAERARGAEALEALADSTTEPLARAAFRVASAFRYQLAERPLSAMNALRKIQELDPSDPVVAAGLSTLHRKNGEPLLAADVLVRAADGLEDAVVMASLEIEAGLICWLEGDRTRAIDCFERAARHSPDSASALLAWSLRAADPDRVESRRRALDAASPGTDEGGVALERFALDVGDPAHREGAAGHLHATGAGVTSSALDVARALSPASDDHAAALGRIAELGKAERVLVRATTYMATLRGRTTSDEKVAAAAAWATEDASVAAALEWLGQAVASKDRDREVAAREHVAEVLPETLSPSARASARLVSALAHDDLVTELMSERDAMALLTNLEISPPSCEPRRRAAVLFDSAAALDDESAAVALGIAGWNLLAASDAAGAIEAFRRYLDVHGEDIVGWEGLRAAAELAQDKALLAEASAALGDLVSDPGQGAELWERSATILFDELMDPVRGEAALSRAVERDIGRDDAFDRLFRIVRSRKDGVRLLELISARLAVAEDPDEIAKLYWERARALREAGDVEGAFEALENVTMLEPDHLGALALTGEIHIMNKRFAEAAESLARLATLRDAPVQQRLMSGMAAVDLYENRLSNVKSAIEVLEKLHVAGLATLPVRERLARAAAKGESWETAVTALEELMTMRESREGRVEAARLAMAIHRDRLNAPAGADKAVERLLAEAPSDGEALDMLLSGAFPKSFSERLLAEGRRATLDALVRSPLDVDGVSRLAEMARKLDDVQLRQVALGAVLALGEHAEDATRELQALDRRVARVPQIAIDDKTIALVRDPEDRGAIPEIFQLLAPTLAENLGPGLAALGVTKKERIRPQDGLPIRNEIAAWAGALALGEFELYVGGRDPNGIAAVATELPAFVVGANVESPLSAAHRAILARELLGLKLGTTILRHRDPADIAALVVAACSAVGVRIETPPYAMLGEFERLLSRELPRRVRKVLPELAAAVSSTKADPVAWVRAATGSLDRMAAVAIGDVSWVLAGSDGGPRREAPKTIEGKQRAARLLSFALSPDFFAVRDKLGMGVK